jgi:hypothetical protein
MKAYHTRMSLAVWDKDSESAYQGMKCLPNASVKWQADRLLWDLVTIGLVDVPLLNEVECGYSAQWAKLHAK